MTLRFIAALFCMAPGFAMAQVATVPIGDPVYQDIDRVLATGLVESGFSSQRPYTRREIARMLISARRTGARAGRHPSPATQRIMDRLVLRFAPEIRMLSGEDVPDARRAVVRWRAELLGLSSPSRRIPEDLTGSVDASINPMLNDRSGRQFGEGANLAGELEYERALFRQASVRVRPRLVTAAHAGAATAHGSLQSASALVQLGNVIAEIGRHDVVLAQGMESGFLSSSSARPLDMVRFSTDAPFRVPIVSKLLGTFRGNLLIADLGRRQHFPHSMLVQYKLAAFPFHRLEISAAVQGVQRGTGAPVASAWEHFKDLVPALKYLFDDDTSQFSNKMAGWEYRLRLPELRGLQLYAEHAFEDMDPRRWPSTFWEDGGLVVGASLQDLAGDGALSGTLEFQHTGLRFYEHTIFKSGMAFNGTLLGNPLGNDANGAYLRLRWDDGRQRALNVDVAVERRDGDLYRTLADPPNDDNFRFERLANNPAEWRERVVASWITDIGVRRTTFQIGVERVQSFAFMDGRNRTNVLVGAMIDAYGR